MNEPVFTEVPTAAELEEALATVETETDARELIDHAATAGRVGSDGHWRPS